MMNSVNISGFVRSIPTKEDFIVQVDDEFIHCACCGFAPVINEEVVVMGKLCSYVEQIRGKNVLLYKIAPTTIEKSL